MKLLEFISLFDHKKIEEGKICFKIFAFGQKFWFYCEPGTSYEDFINGDLVVVAGIKDYLEAQCYQGLAEYKAYFKDEFVDEEQMHEKVKFLSKEDMAFKFCCESLGNGWSLENAKKLLRPIIMESWIGGAAHKRGLCVDFKTCTSAELKEALADAIKKCIACYGSSQQKAEFE